MRAGDVHGTSGPDSRARRLSVRTPSVQDYFKSGCEQQPSPNARETRPPRGRVFRFLRSVFEGWARVAGEDWVGPAGAVTTPGVGPAGSVPTRCER
jgi:hypothetical protein